MTLQEALKNKGKPFWIPGAKRADLPPFFKSLGFQKGVEIGVSWGQNIVDYCKEGFDICGIDPWKDSRDNNYRKIVSIDGKYGQSIEGVYQLAKERTKDYPKCALIRKTSEEAIDDFPDRSLDFVYIDGNHNFGYVAMDLMLWCRKVRKGGIIAGHDYWSHSPTRRRMHRHPGNVVDAFVKSYDIPNFWVLGTQDGKDDDTDLSFFLFKHW